MWYVYLPGWLCLPKQSKQCFASPKSWNVCNAFPFPFEWLCGQRIFSIVQTVTLCAGFHKSGKNMIILISKDSICILMSCQRQHRGISGRQETKDKGLCIWEGRTLHPFCLMWIVNAAIFPNNACVMMCEIKACSSQHWMPHPSSYCPAQTQPIDLWHCKWVT